MPRPKKDNKAMSIRIDRTVFDRLEAYCEASGQSKTLAIERALSMYMDEYDKTQEIIRKVQADE